MAQLPPYTKGTTDRSLYRPSANGLHIPSCINSALGPQSYFSTAMNKIYRAVWSETRQAYVVTHEKAVTRGKSSSQKVIAASVLLALAGMASSAMGSSCGAVTASSGMYGGCNLGFGESFIVDNGTNVTYSGTNAALATIQSGAIAGGIVNSGGIYSTQT